MGRLRVTGGRKLAGSIQIQGAKNSVLPILAASILVKGESLLQNCPDLKDVEAAIEILRHLGCKVKREGKDVNIDSSTLSRFDIPDHLMREMRSSVIFLGAILGRAGEAILSMPGGCELGPRPIDLHLGALRALGAEIDESGGNIVCKGGNALRGTQIKLASPSVGATENAMLAAVSAKGETVIENAAREPEIVDLQNFLVASGADIRGAGQSTIYISGGKERKALTYKIMPDRIVAATYLSAVASAGGELELLNIVPEHIETVINCLREAGAEIRVSGRNLHIASAGRLKAIPPINTSPYPGFPTDAQPCLLASLVTAKGKTVFVENIFQNRYRYVEELLKMGADIRLEGKVALIHGVEGLKGAKVSATDLRGGAALVIAALRAEGESIVDQVWHIDRGYDKIEETLGSLGADIERLGE